jgi:hypothetical protein
MDAASFNKQGDVEIGPPEGIANFVTMDMVKEQLAVVEHYLATTPATPFTMSRRMKLSQEKDVLSKMIEKMSSSEDENSSGRNSSDENTPSSQTPAFLTVLPSNANSAPISGFSTPDIYSSRQQHPFASAVEESLYDDGDRLAQEIA